MKNALPQNPLEFNGIIDLMDKIPTDDAAMEYFKLIRWAGHVTCPYCNSEKVYERKTGKGYKCGGCKVQFTAKSNTIFADSKIGKRVKELRLAKGLSLRGMADMMNIDNHQLQRIEEAEINTSILMVYHLAKVLEVPISELFAFEV